MAMPGDTLSPSCLQYTGDNSAQGILSGMAGNPYSPWTSKASASTAFLYKVDCGLISRVVENNTTLLLQVQNACRISPVSKRLKVASEKVWTPMNITFSIWKKSWDKNHSPQVECDQVLPCASVSVCKHTKCSRCTLQELPTTAG